jgi:hypothetical protein
VATIHVFERALSLRLDLVIIALDRQPAWPRRRHLQIIKAWLERRVPAVNGGAR